jgi:two-component system, LuxR family, sensor kinase FixL
MPWVEALSDPQELRRCIRDLVALSTLPAIWTSYEPRQIAESIAAALISVLHADFVHVTLPRRRDWTAVDVTQTDRSIDAAALSALRAALNKHLPRTSFERTVKIANPLGEGTLRIAFAPIGLGGEAILAVGCSDPAFPTEPQRLLIGTAANEATIALQRWHAETEELRFVALVESSSDFIGFSSLDGAPLYINPAGLKLAGLRGIEEASRLHVLDFVASEERPRARDDLWPKVMRTGRWIGEIGFRNFKTGETIPLLVDWFRIDSPRTGKPMNMGVVASNLTAQKRSQAELGQLNESLEQRVRERTAELADANRTLTAEIAERERADVRIRELQLELFHAGRLTAAGELAATLAHELSQPLTATANSINAARRLLARNQSGANGKIGDVLAEASGQAQRARHIMRRLRDFVRRGETEKHVENVVTLIEDAGSLALTGSDSLGVKVQFRFDPHAKQVFVDRVQIQQVLVNLMRNAVEAMAGRARRELAVTTVLLDDETVEISVADSGPGLPDEISNRIFEPFISTKANGIGLGLSICRSLVEAHGGKLQSKNGAGGGAVFRFTLAVAPTNGAGHAG